MTTQTTKPDPIYNPDSELVVTTELEAAGLISYWRMSESVRLDDLAKRWAAEGLDAEMLPKAPDDVTALGRAVADQAAKRILVRPLARRGAWAIVQEFVSANGDDIGVLDHVTLMHVRMGVNGAPTIKAFNDVVTPLTVTEPIKAKIYTAYCSHQNRLDGSDVSSWLIKLAKDKSAVSLRDTGGVYFVPKQHVDFWRKVARAVEGAVGFRVFRIPAMKNAEAVAAIVDAVQAEAAQVAAKMEEELLGEGDDKLGTRAVKTRQGEIESLLGKLVDYEKLLGLQLDVRARVEALSANLAIAAMSEESAAT